MGRSDDDYDGKTQQQSRSMTFTPMITGTLLTPQSTRHVKVVFLPNSLTVLPCVSRCIMIQSKPYGDFDSVCDNLFIVIYLPFIVGLCLDYSKL